MKKIVLFIFVTTLVFGMLPVDALIQPRKAFGVVSTTIFTNSVDVDGNLDYNDNGKTVFVGGVLSYRLDFSYNPGEIGVANPYINVTLPGGTAYHSSGASPISNMQWLNGSSWTDGEPPNNSPSGTQIRWRLPNVSGGWTGANGSTWNYTQNSFTPVKQPSDINITRTNTDLPASLSEAWYDMVYDSNGYPCVVWQDNGDTRSSSKTEPNIYFVRWNGTNWVGQNGTVYNPTSSYPNKDAMIASPGNITQKCHPRLALDSNDCPHIVFDAKRPNGNVDVHYVRWDKPGNQWVNNTGSSPTAQSFIAESKEDSVYPQVKIGSDNNPVIGWFEWDKNCSIYNIFFCKIIDNKKEKDLAGGNKFGNYKITRSSSSNRAGTGMNFVLDSNNRPNIVFENGNPADICFAKWTSSNKWQTITNVDYSSGTASAIVSNTSGTDSLTPWVRLNSSGNPKVCWGESRISPKENVVCYLSWNPTQSRWENADGTVYNATNLTSKVTLGSKPSMDLDKNSYPNIAFNGGFMRWDGGKWINGSKNAISVNTTDGTGSLNTFEALFNPIDIVTINGTDKIGIVTGLVGNPSSAYDAAFIQYSPPTTISGTFKYQLNISSVVPAVTNYATFTSSNGISLQSNTVVNPMLEISVVKSASKSSYMRTDEIGFDILVNNPTGGLVTNVVVTDTIPANLVFKSASLTPTSATSTSVIFNVGNFTPNSIIAIHLIFTLDPSYQFHNVPLNVTNNVVVTSSQFSAKRASATTTINETLMTFTKTAGKTKYLLGDKVSFTLVLENLGTTSLSNVEIVDQISPDLVFDSITPQAGAMIDSQYKIWIGTLNPGQKINFTLTFTISDTTIKSNISKGLASFSISNTAVCKADNFESKSSIASTKIMLPKVSVSISADKFQVKPGNTVTYTIVARNISDVPTTNTVLYGIFPNGLDFVNSLPAGSINAGRISYELGTFAPGETQRYEVTMKVKSSQDGMIMTSSAILSCKELGNQNSDASVKIVQVAGTEPLQLSCKWVNLDTKSNILSGDLLQLQLNANGGSSPYDYTVDWGDGSKSTSTSKPDSETVKLEHQFTSGQFKISITCIDRASRSKLLTRTITVK